MARIAARATSSSSSGRRSPGPDRTSVDVQPTEPSAGRSALNKSMSCSASGGGSETAAPVHLFVQRLGSERGIPRSLTIITEHGTVSSEAASSRRPASHPPLLRSNPLLGLADLGFQRVVPEDDLQHGRNNVGLKQTLKCSVVARVESLDHVNVIIVEVNEKGAEQTLIEITD